MDFKFTNFFHRKIVKTIPRSIHETSAIFESERHCRNYFTRTASGLIFFAHIKSKDWKESIDLKIAGQYAPWGSESGKANKSFHIAVME
jgi:hypothetical protein